MLPAGSHRKIVHKLMPATGGNVWADCVSQERIWLDSGSRWYAAGPCIDARIAALMGVRTRFW